MNIPPGPNTVTRRPSSPSLNPTFNDQYVAAPSPKKKREWPIDSIVIGSMAILTLGSLYRGLTRGFLVSNPQQTIKYMNLRVGFQAAAILGVSWAAYKLITSDSLFNLSKPLTQQQSMVPITFSRNHPATSVSSYITSLTPFDSLSVNSKQDRKKED